MRQESRKNKILRKNQNVFRTDKEYLERKPSKSGFKKRNFKKKADA